MPLIEGGFSGIRFAKPGSFSADFLETWVGFAEIRKR